MQTARRSLTFALGLLIASCAQFEWEPPPVPGVMHPPPVKPMPEDDGFDDDDDDSATKPTPKPGGNLAAKIADFAPVTITTDVSNLPQNEKAALDKLIAAAKLLDPVFDRQVWAGNPELEKKLSGDKLAYFKIMRGPWDRQDEFKPFATDKAHPKGAGFYPEDLTVKELDAYLAKHPDEQKQILGLFTVVKRKGGALTTVGYSAAYAEWLKPAAALLREAADLTQNETLKKFLRSRADAFLNDDYYQSDVDWVDLDSRVEVTIGPYEVYEDELKNSKAAFEAFVTLADPAASQKLAKYKKLLPSMEQNLPVPAHMKSKSGRKSPIKVVDLVFASGDARKSVQTIAFNLPNDETIREKEGSKYVLLRNVINAKYDRILKPLGAQIIHASQLQHLGADGFFNETLFHELSHSLGPGKIKVDNKEVEVREAMQELHSGIEECKADVMGAYNVLFMVKRKEFPAAFRQELLVTYFAGLFRSVRFGVAEAHGRGAALQINRHIAAGGAVFDEATKTFIVDFDKLETSISDLTRDLVVLQFNGDKAGAKALLDQYGVASAPLKAVLAKLGGIPVDLQPTYPLAGESSRAARGGRLQLNMRLHEVVTGRQRDILEHWMERVRGTAAPETMPPLELVDHLPRFLDELAGALREDESGGAADELTESSATAAEHGAQRLRLGFSLEAVVREYGALRHAVVATAEVLGATATAHQLDVVFDWVIGGIASAVAEYAMQRDAEQQRQTTEHYAFIAHELRGPLAAAVTALRLLERKELLPSSHVAQTLGRSVRRASELVDQTLHVARGSVEVQVRREPTTLSALFDDVEADVSADAETKAVEVRHSISGDRSIAIDARLVRSALGNLVQNAVKFSEAGGTVELRGAVGEGRAVIEVEDCCGGLDPGQVEQAFSPFVRFDHGEPGFGLGLAIAKNAVDAHGGGMRVQNIPRKGCIFVLEIPF